jgi:hypothetical protein
MRQEITWGTAAALAVVAAVGLSSQSGSNPAATSTAGRSSPQSTVGKLANRGTPGTAQPQCADSVAMLHHFFLHENLSAPAACYVGQPDLTKPTADFHPDFVIATFPDPLHTHFSLLFDRFVEALQQSAQDEGYEYDSSWLPWETEEPALTTLKDQDEDEVRTANREDQPGILLFRGPGDSPYEKALIVFVVGEEPTRGIHRQQFENAVAWIESLQKPAGKRSPVAILGPTFSGSFPSLSDLLAKGHLPGSLNGTSTIEIYSGSATSREAGIHFAKTSGVNFRSFLVDDDTAMDRFCRYLAGAPDAKFKLKNLAIVSEDETAYGQIITIDKAGTTAKKAAGASTLRICPDAIHLYYPRDISTLRAAYQTQSMFSSSSAQQNQNSSPRKSLPTDLADPSGEQHDTVRTYAGNQTPLSQEAQLLGIVDALRANRAQYVLLRSSNSLDPLFLANFLRRDYPESRIVIMNSDLLFQRGQDAMALSGVMTLSTYPLFSWAREWTSIPPYETYSHRVFPETTTQGTYIASRVLLQSLAKADRPPSGLDCQFGDNEVFVPSLRCDPHKSAAYAPIPDYTVPYWTTSEPCELKATNSACRPVTWLSVITRNGTWPLAALNDDTLLHKSTDPAPLLVGKLKAPDSSEDRRWPDTPRSMRALLVVLCGLVIFHSICCRFASFTAKPAFRAHFATPGLRHTILVLIGSSLLAVMALITGWGCGIFAGAPGPPTGTPGALPVVVFVCLLAAVAMVENIVMTRKLGTYSGHLAARSTLPAIFSLVCFGIVIWAFFFGVIHPLEGALSLSNRAFVYWRSMSLASGVSPIVPFLSLALGLYLWFWSALHGLALFGLDRPCLPPLYTLNIKLPTAANPREELKLTMFSQERIGTPAERVAAPLAAGNLIAILIIFVVMALVVAGLSGDVPVRSLGARRYAWVFCFALDFYFCMILTESWQIWRTWSCARQLLVFLDRLGLRRTLAALHGFSWGSVWKMSGNVLDVRYKVLSRQLECLTHLHNSLSLFTPPDDPVARSAFAGVPVCLAAVDRCHSVGFAFAKWYSEHFDKPKASDLRAFEKFQRQVADATGVVLTELILPASRLEKHSLIQVEPDDKGDDDHRQGPRPSKNELIRNAEELVCLTYLGFAQNLLGRIRTIVLGGVYLFVAATIAVSSYPFDPRPLLSGALLFLFIAFGGVVVFTYADMFRDATLSHVTNTKPGELGSEFWFKVLGYGAAPLLGLITQVFPEWSGVLFSWLQPGLSSLR